MLTRLRFKNWRSLRDVEINDLTPITVFIGANSSGKTNIVDALRFIRHSYTRGNKGILETIHRWEGRTNIQTMGVSIDEPVELEFSLQPPFDSTLLRQEISIRFKGEYRPIILSSKLYEGDTWIAGTQNLELPLTEPTPLKVSTGNPLEKSYLQDFIAAFVSQRWQILGENFVPSFSAQNDRGISADSLYLLAYDGSNFPNVLSFIKNIRFDLFNELQEDLRWLLGHISSIETYRTDYESRWLVKEKFHEETFAPTISSGTARLIAMLTAFYLLDMDMSPFESQNPRMPENLKVPIAHLPGLVVIEEADTALNPGLLKRFVEQLRIYTSGEHPRQVFLTTHNPALLNLFEPEEVRVVERDEHGYTIVNQVPDHIRDIWLDEYGLGEVWMTRALGGIPD